MAFEFDWAPLSDTLLEHIQNILESVPVGITPVLHGHIQVQRLVMGDVPPTIALTQIKALAMDRQVISAVVRYDGNAQLQIKTDLNINILGATPKDETVHRFMGTVYEDTPAIIRSRILLSAIRLTVKVEIEHVGDKLLVRFEDEPQVEVSIDSNFCSIGVIFDLALGRITRLVKKRFRDFAQPIEIQLPK